jgi:2'-5' RNA ligase
MHYGKTDDFSYNMVENPVQARDLHATMLHLFGVDHQKLAGVAKSLVIKDIIG